MENKKRIINKKKERREGKENVKVIKKKKGNKG